MRDKFVLSASDSRSSPSSYSGSGIDISVFTVSCVTESCVISPPSSSRKTGVFAADLRLRLCDDGIGFLCCLCGGEQHTMIIARNPSFFLRLTTVTKIVMSCQSKKKIDTFKKKFKSGIFFLLFAFLAFVFCCFYKFV